MNRLFTAIGGLTLCVTQLVHAAELPRMTLDQSMPAGIWQPDQGDGTFKNPILQGDYSDPDVVRVGDDFYLTASSFANVPGLPILHSRDLVNWSLIGYGLSELAPEGHYSVPRRGGGVWAPAIRYHRNQFYIYYPDPDFGIFVITAQSPAGPWSKPKLIDQTKGVIDPCPFWEEDGTGYMVYAYAKSRAGKANIIEIKKLSADGMSVSGKGKVIIDADKLPRVKTSYGDLPWFTTEGPKMYKRDNYYYVFAPSGSVKGGWQAVFRSKNIDGPYEARSVMDQGATEINGPHQGAWVNTAAGEDWFIHFQQTDSYGRRVLLQPMQWQADGWPIIGERQGDTHFGQPVLQHAKPKLKAQKLTVPLVNDEFDKGFNLAWQWNSNPAEDWIDSQIVGKLRLKSVSSSKNLWEAGNLLSQKLPGMAFSAITKMSFHPKRVGERAGLAILGYNYGWIGLENTAAGVRLVQVTREQASQFGEERVLSAPVEPLGEVYLKLSVTPQIVAEPEPDYPVIYPSLRRSYYAHTTFSYSLDGKTYNSLGEPLLAQPGRWVGAQVGIFSQAASGTPAFVSTSLGYADFDFYRVTAE